MSLSDFGIIFSIIATIVTGINFVFIFLGRSFWSLTFKKLEHEVIALKEEVKDHEKKNAISRHDFANVTKSVYAKMDDLELSLTKAIDKGFDHIKELFNTKIKNLEDKINEKK
jgi:hypothetical protein